MKEIEVVNKPHPKFRHEEGSVLIWNNDIFEWSVETESGIEHYYINILDEIEKGNFKELSKEGDNYV